MAVDRNQELEKQLHSRAGHLEKEVCLDKDYSQYLDAYYIVLQLTYRQPVQNGGLTDQLCRALYYIHLSTMPIQIAITIT